MARGHPVRADHDPPRQQAQAPPPADPRAARRSIARMRDPFVDTDTSIPWDATLIQPNILQQGSRQPIIVEVTAPVTLDAQPVMIRVGSSGATPQAGRWIGEPAQKRRVTADVIGFGSGRRDVFVEVDARPHRPLLRAGRIMFRV